MRIQSLEELQHRLAEFAAARDWEQFHTPKNLAMALAGEVGELVAEFQWMTSEEAQEAMQSSDAESIRMEMADVFIYLARLADTLGIDLYEAAEKKIALNSERFTKRGVPTDS
jgi:NTP pyrophosphatase (non-canonical NTP hydrolase)